MVRAKKVLFYRQLVRRAKQTWVEQIILSEILSVMESRDQGYRNCQRMAINICGDNPAFKKKLSLVLLPNYNSYQNLSASLYE